MARRDRKGRFTPGDPDPTPDPPPDPVALERAERKALERVEYLQSHLAMERPKVPRLEFAAKAAAEALETARHALSTAEANTLAAGKNLEAQRKAVADLEAKRDRAKAEAAEWKARRAEAPPLRDLAAVRALALAHVGEVATLLRSPVIRAEVIPPEPAPGESHAVKRFRAAVADANAAIREYAERAPSHEWAGFVADTQRTTVPSEWLPALRERR